MYPGAAPFAYRLGPELYAGDTNDARMLALRLAEQGQTLDCLAVVVARTSSSSGHDRRLREPGWGICALPPEQQKP